MFDMWTLGDIDPSGKLHADYLVEYMDGNEYVTRKMQFVFEPGGWETIHAGDLVEIIYGVFARVLRVESIYRSEVAV